MTGSGAELVEFLRTMLRIRAFDSRLPELYTKGLLRGSAHAAVGQEAVAVGACAALESTDFITSTHRGHGHAIAKGADLRRMMAELFGRADGVCRGKGGSMHIADFSVGMLGANGIVGGSFGIAAGAALGSQLRNDGRVTVCFFGEGASNQGAFHEAANFAGIWKLPIVFLCENNQYAMSARVEEMVAGGDIAARAAGYGFPGSRVDGMDVEAVRAAIAAAADRARAGAGPSLVVADCYRFEGHFTADTMAYRRDGEADEWAPRDPIAVLRARLIAAGALTDADADAIEANAAEEIADAINFASMCSYPEPMDAFDHVLA